MNLNKILAVADLFRKGSAVANKEAWKKGQITATMLGGAAMALVGVAQAFGYPIPAWVSPEAVEAVSGLAITAVNVVGTYVTSEQVGILPAKEPSE